MQQRGATGINGRRSSLPLMPEVFNALPGIEVPVGSISKSLSQIWTDPSAPGEAAGAGDDVKATQLNLVLHLGFATTPDDGCTQFQTALRFAHRYPCRVVVLCPLSQDGGVTELRAKVYGECFLGKSKGDTRCVEFVALSYPVSARRYLENQVSVCLSTDLPLCYWAHRFSLSSRLADYQYLLRTSKRVIFDTAIVPGDALTHPWPRPDLVRDLASARLLPVRQSMGQFLAGVSPARLVEGLFAVNIAYVGRLAAEAHALQRWLSSRLVECGASNDLRFLVKEEAMGAGMRLSITFGYSGANRFQWQGDFEAGQACFETRFGADPIHFPTAISLLSPEAALGEALFY